MQKSIIIIISLFSFVYSECNAENFQEFQTNLDGCDLSGADLYGTDFSYYSLVNADLSNSNLGNCNFTGSNLENANLVGASTWNTNFTDALMCGVDTSQLNFDSGNPITDLDCFDVCGGSGQLDECGVCDGDGTACFGCMDPFATNYSELAIYDDGSCEYFDGESDGDAPSLIWEHRLYDNYNYTFAVNGLDNLILDYSENNFDSEGGNLACVPAQDNSVICKGTYNHESIGWEENYNEGWNGSVDQYGGVEIFIYKLDSNGELVWFTEHGNWSGDDSWVASDDYTPDYSRGSIVELDGYYYISGEINSPLYSGFILKLNEQGEQVWIRIYDILANQDDLIMDIAASNSSICATGHGYSVSGNNNNNNSNGIIACYSTDGTELFTSIVDYQQPDYLVGNSYGDRLYSLTALSNGDFMAFGWAEYKYNEGGNSIDYPRLVRFNDSGVIFDKIITEITGQDLRSGQSDIIEINDEHILILGDTGQDYAALMVVDQDGNYVSSATDHLNFELGMDGSSSFRSATRTNDNKLLLAGFGYRGFYGNQFLLAKIDMDLNFEWVTEYGPMFGENDKAHNVIQLPNNRIVVTGESKDSYQTSTTPTVISYNYADGCLESAACNYNPIATFDNGSCYYEDACDVCDGNGYDFCDDDNDGVNNLDQWGYGVYNLEISDVPEDQGGNVFISFNKSFYDTDELQGNRSEMYTIELMENEQWYAAQSVGAYASNSYNVIVPTLRNNEEVTFRVIANMDEGNFLSYEMITGMSIDNLAPGAPEMLLGDFDGGQVTLSWNSSVEPDFLSYSVYRDGEHYGDSMNNSFVDTQLPDIPTLNYTVSAHDVNGNESVQSQQVNVLVHIDGDLNEDYTLNVLDVVIMMEHILNFSSLEDTTYADLNNDATVNVLDVIILVNIILDMNGDQ